jgi:superfamily II DNA or RNA helicase
MNKIAKVSIKHNIIVNNLKKRVKKKIESELTWPNPKYEQALKYGKFISIYTKPTLKYFTESDGIYILPKGYYFRLIQIMNKEKQKYTIEDETLLLPEIDISFHGKLRKYQNKAVKDILKKRMGVLEAQTGSGKTIIALEVIAIRKQPTLIIVHNKELLYQWKDRIKKFLDYECGMIGDEKYVIKDITVGIINSVRNKTEELKHKFGQIIVDETHRCPSVTWTNALNHFPAKYQLGLSATPYRRDELDAAIYAYVGPKVHIVSKKVLYEEGAVLKPKIIRIYSDFYYRYKNNYGSMIKALTNDYERNNLIVKKVLKNIQAHNDNILIVSDRINHCKEIQMLLKTKGIKSSLLISSVPKEKRRKIVQNLNKGKIRIIIATVSLLGEGFDCSELSSLFLTTPIKFKGRLLQIIGRILRPEENKVPKVYDFRDNDVYVLKHQGYKRDEIYSKEWEE